MEARVDTEILRRTAIFRSLGESDFAALTMCLRVRTAEPGEVLFREGDPGESMMIVGEGTLAATVRRKDGTQQEINRMGPCETIGEMAFLDPAPRSATVHAVTRTSFYELDEDGLATLRRRAPTAAAALVWATLRDVTRRLRRMDRLIQHELGRNDGASTPGRGVRVRDGSGPFGASGSSGRDGERRSRNP